MSKRQPQSKEEMKKRVQDKRDYEQKQRLIQQAFNSEGELSQSWMEQVLDVDRLEDKLQKSTNEHIKAMINKQWILGNLTNAEAHDRVYKLEVMKLKILGAHPVGDSIVQGEARAFFFDDENEQLKALYPRERNRIDQIITTLQNMVTRSRDGFERKQINTSIAVSENALEEEEGVESGWGGLFS